VCGDAPSAFPPHVLAPVAPVRSPAARHPGRQGRHPGRQGRGPRQDRSCRGPVCGARDRPGDGSCALRAVLARRRSPCSPLAFGPTPAGDAPHRARGPSGPSGVRDRFASSTRGRSGGPAQLCTEAGPVGDRGGHGRARATLSWTDRHRGSLGADHPRGQLVGRRVLGPVARGAAVTDHKTVFGRRRVRLWCWLRRRRGRAGEEEGDGDQGRGCRSSSAVVEGHADFRGRRRRPLPAARSQGNRSRRTAHRRRARHPVNPDDWDGEGEPGVRGRRPGGVPPDRRPQRVRQRWTRS
jgi:hypothetical protein